MSNGEKSNVPWYGQECKIVSINPPESIISKILVSYDETDVFYGIKLFTKEGTCVLEAGGFDHEKKRDRVGRRRTHHRS